MANDDESCERKYAAAVIELNLKQPVLLGELKAFCLVAEGCGHEADDEITRRGTEDKLRAFAIGIDIQALAQQLQPGPAGAAAPAPLPKN